MCQSQSVERYELNVLLTNVVLKGSWLKATTDIAGNIWKISCIIKFRETFQPYQSNHREQLQLDIILLQYMVHHGFKKLTSQP